MGEIAQKQNMLRKEIDWVWVDRMLLPAYWRRKPPSTVDILTRFGLARTLADQLSRPVG